MNIYASGRPIEQYYLRWERFANPFIQWVASVVISLLLWNKCKTYFNLSRVFFIYWYIKASIATGTCQSSGWEGGGVKQDHIFYSTLLLLVLIVFRIFVYIFELLCFIDLGVGWLSVCVCVCAFVAFITKCHRRISCTFRNIRIVLRHNVNCWHVRFFHLRLSVFCPPSCPWLVRDSSNPTHSYHPRSLQSNHSHANITVQ